MTTLTELRNLADDPEACITGTPMIPLHRDTVRKIADVVEAAKVMRGWISDPIVLTDSVARDVTAFDAALAKLEQEQSR